jgi:uncharacterized membrane protein YukC
MENNTDVLLYLNEINTNLQTVVEELKKLNKNKQNAPNLFDIFGGMNQPGGEDDDDDDEEEDDDDDEEEEAEEEEAEEEEAEEEDKNTKDIKD